MGRRAGVCGTHLPMMPMKTEVGSATTDLLILAGGLGTRLRQAVRDVPKPMAPINGLPFLEYLMAHWRKQGIRRFVLSVGYMADSIEAYFGTRHHSCIVAYAREDAPLGTGGAIRDALINGTYSSERLTIVNGDTWFPVSLARLAADADQTGKPVTIAVKRMADNDRYGGIVLDENGLVRQFIAASRSETNPVINGGTYLVNRAWLAKQLRHRTGTFSFEHDVLEALAAAGMLAASVQDVEFLDIGIPEDYLRAGQLILRDTIRQPHSH